MEAGVRHEGVGGARGPRRALHLALAFVSGGPALVYQVVWIREVGLVLGSQVESISVVLVAFFGGLALGSRELGRRADRAASPLRLYGWLEVIAGVLACGSPLILRGLGEHAAGRVPAAVLFAGAAAVMFIITFFLGGTLPALLRSTLRDPAASAREAGWLVGANTAGAIVGVGAAVVLVPWIGLRATTWLAGATAIAVGVAALVAARTASEPKMPTARPAPPRTAVTALLVAALGGVATIAFEVLAARTAALWLGSSLLAWAAVLVLFLVGLAAGNGVAAARAARTRRPAITLGVIEITAAIILVAGAAWAVPDLAGPATGLTKRAVVVIGAWVFPTTFLMGAAFPFFVRLGVGPSERIGEAFGAISAANTAGGILGALLAPFVLLPALGLAGALTACATLNALLGLCLLAGGADARGARGARMRLARTAVAAVIVAAAMLGFRLAPWSVAPAATAGRVIHVSHGRQATAAVVRSTGRRDLFVDGDAEASTAGTARDTEELLGALPFVLHPAPSRFLEVGLGSGITLGTAARLPLDTVECVEIAASVIACAPYFAPANGRVAHGDGRIRIMRGDGRAHLLAHPASYDVIVANTLHPWSVGATGLYSREYFTRIRRALRPGGVAAQWLPIERIDRDHLATIVRTFYEVFPGGSTWWGAENIIVIGRPEPGSADPDLVRRRFDAAADVLRGLRIDDADALWGRRLGSADDVREALGPGPVLTDDRPMLETAAVLRRGRTTARVELDLVERIAQHAALAGDAVEPLLAWVQSRRLRERGETRAADRLEAQAEAAGFEPARRGRAQRYTQEALAAFAEGRRDEAEQKLQRALTADPMLAEARFSLAILSTQENDRAAARNALERLVADHPDHADGWNTLAVLLWSGGDRVAARRAVDRALDADPYFPEGLANGGLFAAATGDPLRAGECLARLRAIDPREAMPETRALRAAIAGESSRRSP